MIYHSSLSLHVYLGLLWIKEIKEPSNLCIGHFSYHLLKTVD